MMVFETQRLIIRGLTSADLEGFHKLQSNPNVMRYTGGNTITSLAENEQELHKLIAAYSSPGNDFWVWAVIRKTNDEFLGTCALIANDEGEKEIGYRFREQHWGNGYGSEVTTAVIEYGFEKRDLKKIAAYVYTANQASVRILERHMSLEKEFFNEAAQCLDRKYVVYAENPNSIPK